MITSFAIRRPKTILLSFLALTLVASVGVMRLQKEEDLLVFLPANDPDVQLFKEVSRTFGSLRVAMVGVEAPDGKDIFHQEVIGKIAAASTAMRNLANVENVVSLTRVEDVMATEAGAEIKQLVDALPQNAADEKALRERVMARDHIVGSLVSKDGRAALIMVFLTGSARDREVTTALRATAARELPGLAVFYGGAPFAGIDIYDEAQKDVRLLSPLALLVLLLVVVLSFRDPVGVALTIASVGLSTLWVVGGMGWIGDKYTVATSTMPVILFASGSTYAVNLLGRYYLAQKSKAAGPAMAEALAMVGAPLAMAACTAAAGFLSFLVTDVVPMRHFGIACGVGVLLCWLTAVTLIPAVVTLWPRSAAVHAELDRVGDWLVRLWSWARRRRVLVLSLSVLAAVLCFKPMANVPVRMEPSAFFRVGSEPWKASQFMTTRFGGGTFITVAMHGDLDDPRTLREIARFCDYARSLKGVSQVQSVLDYLRITNYAMGSGAKLTTSSAQAANLYTFLNGKGGISALLAEDRQNALVNIRVREEARAVAEALEKFAVRAQPEAPSRNDIADRVAWIARGAGHEPNLQSLQNLLKVVALPGDLDEGWTSRRQAVLKEFLASDDAQILADDEKKELRELVPANPADLGPILGKFSLDSKIAVDNLQQRLADARQEMGVERVLGPALQAAALPPEGDHVKLVRQALDDLFVTISGPPARGPLSAKVAGEPVLERGFSRSVGQTLDRSLTVSRIAVLLFLLILFRSFTLAVACMLPSTLTVFILFGIMGTMGVSIDLGTSLVAGIATGAGADFTLYYMWYLRRQSADEVSRTMGPVMAVSIVLVSFGFVVLALGKSPVMHLFGTLAGVSMSLAAFLTCLLIPALLNKFGRGMESPENPSKSQEGSP